MALFTGQRGTEDTAPDPSSGAPGTDGYRRLNRRCMISIYIYGIWYTISCDLRFSYTSQNLSDPLARSPDLPCWVPAAVLVYVVVAPPIFYTIPLQDHRRPAEASRRSGDTPYPGADREGASVEITSPIKTCSVLQTLPSPPQEAWPPSVPGAEEAEGLPNFSTN